MGQFGFFDADRRLAAISAKGDPLEMIAGVVPFESFRAEIEAAVLTPANEKESTAGRKPIDVMVMFRMLVLQSLYNLSDVVLWRQVRSLGAGSHDSCAPETALMTAMQHQRCTYEPLSTSWHHAGTLPEHPTWSWHTPTTQTSYLCEHSSLYENGVSLVSCLQSS